MAYKIYVSATDQNAGKTTISIALLHLARNAGMRIAFIKPVGPKPVHYDGGKIDKDALTVAQVFALEAQLELMCPVVVTRGMTQQAIRREALEETAWRFTPTALIGVYQWPRPQGDITYLRFAFAGELGAHVADRQLDEGILRAVWMTPAEIAATRDRHRSPLVGQCVQDWLAGRRFPLDVIRHYE
jgi:8-oxo-dGTP pyrophosphatase MutT (NUDIX family)